MKKYLSYGFFTIIFCFVAITASAEMSSIIKLTDGSELAGEVLSLKSGIYSIRTESLGTIKVSKDKVSQIKFQSINSMEQKNEVSSDGNINQADSVIKSQVSSMSKQLLGDKDVMSSILSLQNDPDFKAVLNNPDILKAVKSGDISTLLTHPDFQKLLNHSAVKDISKKVE